MTETDVSLPEWPLKRTCPFSPPPDFRDLRDGPPRLVRHRGGLAWLISRHEDVRQALADPRMSSDDQQPNFPHRIMVPPWPRINSFWRMDQPEHGRLRHMVMPEFTARRTREMRPLVRELVDELLDQMADLPRPVDFATAFAVQLPCLVIARIFGVPDEDIAFFKQQSALILAQDRGPEVPLAAYQAMSDYLGELARAKARRPGDDLISRLAVEYGAAGELTHDDLVGIVRLMIIAGHETTANLLGLTVLALLRHPAQLAELRADAGLVHQVIEEALRYWSISQDNIVRVAAEDLSIGGADIAKGDGVIISIPSANHDESEYPDPGRFDIHRDTKNHVAFGLGPHYCPGAPLARLELEIALPALFERFPGLRLAKDVEELSFREGALVYAVDGMLLTW
ncbi:cytochrome P450 [Streptomyces olivoverticillatus]|uniref:Cytochrome P450 n=1 Tax=Streptomyces olivoverticillatus TaxID=66427 RepID=A0A7W7LNU7_9ACTN|nr:cytochrome P450 [Streptomyces olivoverticillatus]MBB4893665.1 cytochrome P450 [Streptomyces olivoverticillatus]